MATIKQVEMDDGDMIQIRRKGRLNGMFIPIAKPMMGPTMWDVIPELSSSALRTLCRLLKGREDEHVLYVAVNRVSARDLRSLELNNLLRRLTANEHPRMKGHTTVLLSPEFVRTRDPKIVDLWNRRGCHVAEQPGLSIESEELMRNA